MKRNFNVTLTNLDGSVLTQTVQNQKPVVDDQGNPALNNDGQPRFIVVNETKAVIASEVLCIALLQPYTDEQPTAEEKNKRYQIAKRIQAAKTSNESTDYTSEEAILMKTLVAKLYAPLVVGQIVDIIES